MPYRASDINVLANYIADQPCKVWLKYFKINICIWILVSPLNGLHALSFIWLGLGFVLQLEQPRDEYHCNIYKFTNRVLHCARIVHLNSTWCETMNNPRSNVIVVFQSGSRIPNGVVFFPQRLLDIHPFVAWSIFQYFKYSPLCCL